MERFPKSSLTAIILAGGQSNRMGQDKSLIKIHGQPLLTRICTLAEECASQVYVITPWIERYESILPNRCLFIREVLPPHQTKPHGPLLAFLQALSKLETEWVFLLACDLPNLNLAEVELWMSYLPQTPEAALALLPRNPKGWEPLCGFYRRRCVNSLNEFVRNCGQSFQGWLSQVQVMELPVGDPQVLFNCNTPEDLERLRMMKNC
jgi:molybdopterin-guanine dinucleotide biosynthesis protein A